MKEETVLRVGIDVGSTTTKIAISKEGELVYHKYLSLIHI